MKLTLKDFKPQPKMQFQPVVDDDDDLSNAITGDADEHDNEWQLNEDLDGAELASFWDKAVKELGAEDIEK